MKITDIKPTEKMFATFKGEPGTGKTIAASSWPEPYIFDVDGRMKPLVTFWKNKDQINKIEYDTFRSFFRIKDKLKEFRVRCPYKTLVLDSLTSLADAVIRQMIMEKGDSGKKVGGQRVASIEDYGGEASGLLEILDTFIEIHLSQGVNVIWTAHVLQTEMKDVSNPGATSYSRSLLTGGKKIAAKLPAYFDEVWHFQVEPSINVADPPSYTVITRHAGSDYAKTSLPLPAKIDFTGKSLYDEVMRLLKA